MVEGEECRPLRNPFDIRQFQVTSKNYAQGGTDVYVEPEDEAELMKYGLLAESEKNIGSTDPSGVQEERFYPERRFNLEDIRAKVHAFNQRYRDTSPFRRRAISEQVARPGGISDYIKQLRNFTCQICGSPGFRKRKGTLYAEAHHIIELHRLLPGSYCSDNIVIVCPTCHKKLHLASVSYGFTGNQVTVLINGESFSFERNILSE